MVIMGDYSEVAVESLKRTYDYTGACDRGFDGKRVPNENTSSVTERECIMHHPTL